MWKCVGCLFVCLIFETRFFCVALAVLRSLEVLIGGWVVTTGVEMTWRLRLILAADLGGHPTILASPIPRGPFCKWGCITQNPPCIGDAQKQEPWSSVDRWGWPLQAVWLDSASSRHLGWSESILQQPWELYSWGGRGLVDIVWFQGLPGASELFTSCFRSFPTK